MWLTSLAKIQDAVQGRSGLPVLSATTNPSLSRVQNMIEDSGRSLMAIVGPLYGEDYLTKVTTVSVSAGGTIAMLSALSAPMKILRMSWVKSATEEIPIQAAQIQDRQTPSNLSSTNWNDGTPTYGLLADTIEFYPPPPTTVSIKVYYVSGTFVVASAPTQSANVGPGWEEWVTLDVLAKLRGNEKQEADELLLLQDRARQLIEQSAPKRDAWRVNKVRDTRGALGQNLMYVPGIGYVPRGY